MDIAPNVPSVTVESPNQELPNLQQRQRGRLAPRNRPSKDELRAEERREEKCGDKESRAKVEETRNTKVRARSPQPDNSKAHSTNVFQLEKFEQQSTPEIKIKPSRSIEAFPAGREGRQFTVGGVGNNGRIYLRPTARPANQKYTQPRPIFPATPPSTAGLEALAMLHSDDLDISSPSLFTPTHSPTTPYQRGEDVYLGTIDAKSGSRPRHQRRRSNTTGNDQYGSIRDLDAGAFKINIERPKKERRPNTADASNDPPGLPVLEVPIPHYRLGTPRFSMRGTAFLRNSSYTTATGTEDVRSSVYSKRVNSALFTLPISTSDVVLSRRHSQTSPQPHFFRITSSGPVEPEIPLHTLRPEPKAVDPKIFDNLSFPPKRDDQSVVRYAAHTGSIVAATTPRLVAEITSSKFLDYDLLSDFFLTFRSFVSTHELLMLIIARLRWSLSREDEVGMVVRVRTFVALRHWILNYFMDDYVLDYDLRKKFCELLNGFVDELLQDSGAEVNKLRILGELKKCWRRTCALYWDGPEFSSGYGQEVPITPGGIAGHRDANLTPSFWENTETNPPKIEDILHQDQPSGGSYNFFAEVSGSNEAPDTMASVHIESDQPEPPTSPRSQMSFDAVSCSIPTKSMRAAKKSMANNPLAAHPVSPSALWGSTPPPAGKMKTVPKGVRPTLHKRNESFSDSLRDDRQDRRIPIQKAIHKSTELLMALPYAGSLVRGNLFPPGQPFVEAVGPITPSDPNRLEAPHLSETSATQKPSAMSGPGMKKLLGNVRRALSTRVGTSSGNSSSTMGGIPHTRSLGARGATTNRLPGTAEVPQTRNGSRMPMRIDVLGAGIAEDFKKAVREDAEAQFNRRERASHMTIGRASGNEKNEPSEYGSSRDASQSVDPTSSFGGDRPHYERAFTDMTTGSKSIVIIDDTLNQSATMSGGLQNSSSMDTSVDAFMHRSAGPTPPLTPPEQAHSGPQRSSHFLGNNMYGERRSVSMDPINRHLSMARSSRPVSEADFSPLPGLPQRLTMRSYGKSFQSRKSMSLRRYASYQSGFTRKTRERSFDATTFTESVKHNSNIPSLPPPLRLLRRIPGGDLRAVNHVGELNEFGLRRPASTGSITTYSDSVRSSFMLGRSSYVDVDDSLYSQANVQTFSLGALAEASPKRAVSFFDTHSSQPAMRPSFEAEAAKLAQIPDDDYDDGGVEAALLKLEGKFDNRRSNLSVTHLMQDYPASPTSFGRDTFDGTGNQQEQVNDGDEGHRDRLEHAADTLSKSTSLETRQPRTLPLSAPPQKPMVYHPTGFNTVPSLYSEDTEQTYSSIPLLDRSDGDIRRPADRQQITNSNSPYTSRPQSENIRFSALSHPSIDFVEDMNNVRQVLRRAKGTVNSDQDQSFLHVNRDDYSDISSEMSMEVISAPTAIDRESQTFPRVQSEPVVTEVSLPSRSTNDPPSPPVTVEPRVHENQLVQIPFEPLPPTPDATPTVGQNDAMFSRRARSRVSHDPSRSSTHAFTEVSRQSSVHLPFILAFDSEVLAQQFTLIEKDALNEIDWKELIDMRWRNTSTTTVRSWVDFLRTQESRGLEVVIARFNVMVKWAVSECVLTSDINERARCISKLIHIAAHCRRLRNYATMYQLTVALTTIEITRLSRTWAKVPAADLATLSDLETLVQPARNFYELRAEMESASTQDGCIPFVGIYTHDLIFNAERPSVVPSADGKHELINFEKFRMTAHIVKNLLRLLEASGAYSFAPIEGITERCLWMAALSDDEIRILGENIERPHT